MLYLLLSIFGSVSVGVLFKFAKNYSIDILQMVILNYIVTASLSYFIFNVDIQNIPVNLPYNTIFTLGILLPLLFIIQYRSILSSGIIKTDLAQRMSLFIPVLAAIFLFKENISIIRYFALALGLLSVYFIVNRKNNENNKLNKSQLIYPLLVFLGFGIIDIFFKKLALYSAIPYTSSLFYVFLLAFIISIIYYFLTRLVKKQELFLINRYSLGFGLLLGALNLINILFYMKAHQEYANNPTTVFAGMNFGVIILGTLIGYFGLNENLSKRNLLGLIFACISIGLILYF